MKKFGLVAAVAAPLLFGFAHAAPPPVEAFARLPAIAHPTISPDGTKLAVIQDLGAKRALMIYDLATGKSGAVQIGDVIADDVRWANDDRILIWIRQSMKPRGSLETYEFGRIISMSSKGDDFKYMFNNNENFDAQTDAGTLISMLPDDPKNILMAHIDFKAGTKGRSGRLVSSAPEVMYNAYEVNVESGRAKLAEEGNTDTDHWVAGPSGAVRIRVDYDDAHDREVFYSRDGARGALKETSSFPRKDGEGSVFIPDGFDATGQKLYGEGRIDSGLIGLYQYDWSGDGTFTNVFTPDDVDLGGVLIDPYSTSVIGVMYQDDVSREKFFDSELASWRGKLAQAFGGATVTIESWSKDRTKYVVNVERAGAPAQYVLFDAGKMSTSVIGDTYPELAKAPLGTVERYDYTAPDGLVIHGYLTIPPGAEKANLPLIVLPHGGPASRDSMEFDWWREYFATRGYAVYQPNFRGSSGYGYDFEHAGDGEWGAKMQSDITNGVRKLISEGTVDSSRICIVGASYGGYAALAGAAFTPDLYACAASVNGVSNLSGMFAFFKSHLGSAKSEVAQYFEQTMGSSVTDTAFMRSRSPRYNIDAIRTPVLLVHSQDDTTVPSGQSDDMKKALEAAGKSVEFVKLEGEDHYLSKAVTRQQMLQSVGDFVDAHIGGR